MSHLLLIHGAWGGAWEFKDTLANLKLRGHDATAIDLPGHGENPAPISEVTVDAYVQRVIEATERLDGPIVLVGHSLGGAIISAVAEKIPEKIERLVYVAAILPKNGETAMGLMQSDEAGQLLSRVAFSADQSYATIDAAAVRDILLHDVQEPGRVETFIPHFAMKQATEPFLFPIELTNEAFGQVPKSYVRALQDKVMSTSLQDRMRSSWPVDQTFTLDSGHFPLMSLPQRLAEVLSEAASVTTTSA